MQNLKNKLKKQGGFTLVEMLIVVAIIAILIAVSIPMVNSSLEKAKKATDDANLRAAKAVATITYMDGKNFDTNKYYDIDTGSFVDETEIKKNGGYNQTQAGDKNIEAKQAVIEAKVTTTGTGSDTVSTVTVEWVTTPA